MNTSTKLTLILLGLSQAAALNAQENPQSRRGLSIEEVLVTAQKREEGANDIPLAIATYTGEDLVALGVSDTTDLGKLLPGFSYADGGFNTPIYTLRGIHLGYVESKMSLQETSKMQQELLKQSLMQ